MYPHFVSAIGATDAFARVLDTHAPATVTPCTGWREAVNRSAMIARTEKKNKSGAQTDRSRG